MALKTDSRTAFGPPLPQPRIRQRTSVADGAYAATPKAFTHLNAPALSIEWRDPGALMPAPRNPRTHSHKQIQQIAASIRQFGFTNPVLLDADGRILAGHGRVAAAKLLGLPRVPTIRLDHLSEAQRRAYVLADNRLAEFAGWDNELLALELKALTEIDVSFDVEITGFETAEIDLLIESLDQAPLDEDPADRVEAPVGPAVTQNGDLWLLGSHRLLCADARDVGAFAPLLGSEKAQMIFTDPPYNVPVRGHVSGLGRIRHREFAMASGEMSAAEFVAFLTTVLGNLATASVDGAIHYICMDWRHMHELLTAGRAVYAELKNLCVWNKTNGAMGSFYRSKHELVFVFKNGTAPHINNFGLGDTGRYRTNVWDYAGVNTLRPGRADELAMHPTVKPVTLVADAIKDCSRRQSIVLDAFGGSGTTLIAAQKTGRRGYLLEIDPLYVDVAVCRWQTLTGQPARHAGTGLTFDETAAHRARPEAAATGAREVAHG